MFPDKRLGISFIRSMITGRLHARSVCAEVPPVSVCPAASLAAAPGQVMVLGQAGVGDGVSVRFCLSFCLVRTVTGDWSKMVKHKAVTQNSHTGVQV